MKIIKTTYSIFSSKIALQEELHSTVEDAFQKIKQQSEKLQLDKEDAQKQVSAFQKQNYHDAQLDASTLSR